MKPNYNSDLYTPMAIKDIIASCASGAKNFKSRHETQRYSNRLKYFLKDYKYEQHCEVQRQWIEHHRAETKNGDLIIEREMDLQRRMSSYRQLSAIRPLHELADLTALQTIDLELKNLNCQYWLHREKIVALEREKATGALIRAYDRTQNQNSRIRWKFDQIYCQLRGGCCARDCGCCQRSWHTIRHPSGKLKYAHCTRACGCCVRSHGVYCTDPELKHLKPRPVTRMDRCVTN